LFLFILENFGTQELMLIGLAALILLGPRRLPEMARKAGKMMAEFRGTANEFKETWQREVNFEEEAKALDVKELEAESIKRVNPVPITETITTPDQPSIKAADPAKFENLVPADLITKQNSLATQQRVAEVEKPAETNDKKNWL
jgi:sec-independent protein translocase protein TatB